MTKPPLKLRLRTEEFSVAKLSPDELVPEWLLREKIFSVTRTETELSIVCATSCLPAGLVTIERGWRALVVEGPLEFHLTGILSSIAGPLAEAGVSLFAISTFDTDYILVKDEVLGKAIACLESKKFLIQKS